MAGALACLGADVESAFLALASATPELDARVRAALFYHERAPKLRLVPAQRNFAEQYVIETPPPCPRHVCAMHAADLLTQILDDRAVAGYLQAAFPDYDLEALRGDS